MAEGYVLLDQDNPLQLAQANAIADALILGLKYWYSLNEPGSSNYLNPNNANFECPEDGSGSCSNMFPENAAPPSMPWCCDNWWWNVIGKRRELAKIGVLFYDKLVGPNAPTVPNSNPTKTLLQAIIDDMPENVEKHSNDLGESEKYTGANLTDVAVFLVVRGVLEHDYVNGDNNSSPFIEYAIEEVENEALTVASNVPCNEWDDGIQADNSFFQHDKILYSSGYGYSFIRSLSYVGTFLKGTNFDFSATHRGFLLNAILDGWRWMIRMNTADYSVSGRNITRSGNNHTAIPLQQMVWLIEIAEGNDYDCLSPGDPDYVAPSTIEGIALEEMKNRVLAGQRQNILGNKFFWIADYVAHHEENFFTSVKMCATQIADVADPACVATPLHEDINLRTTGTESRNGDNRRGYWLPYGCTFIYQTGEEYTDIFDDGSGTDYEWNKIPGVTSAELSDGDLKPERGGVPEEENGVLEVYNSNHSNFVGSTSNETFAVTTMELDKNHPDGHLQARKAWFHFGGEIIALGAGITDDSDKDVFTTLNQCWENGTVTESTSTHEDYDWVHHDDIAYLYLDPSDTNLDYTDDVDVSTSNNIFTMAVEHDKEPTDARYFYRVVPGLIPTSGNTVTATVESYITANPVEILENSFQNGSYRQAVKKGNLAGIIHYPPTPTANDMNPTFMTHPINVGTTSDPVIITVNQPCAILFDLDTRQICISSPDRSVQVVDVEVTIDDFTYVDPIGLPQGELAGTSTCGYLFNIVGNYVKTHCGDVDDDMDGLLDGNGAGIENVEIYDDNPSTNSPSILLTTTSSTGSYAIQNLLLGLDHELNPKKDDDYYNGISSFDLVLMSKHILELELLDSPYKIIAGDVNKSGSVTTFDITDLRKLILHIDEELENVDSWEFVRSTHLFPNPLNPFQVNPDFPDDINWPFPQTAEINGLQLISSSRDFVGIKMGDVSCSAQTNSLQPPCPETTLQLLAEDQGVRAGNTFTVPIYAETFKNIAAYQMGLRFAPDKLQFNGLQQGDLNKGAKADNFNLNKTAQGKIKTLWLYNEATDLGFTVLDITLADTSALFVLEFEALQDVPSLSSVISIDQSYEAEALPGNGDCYKTIDLQFVQEGSIGERSSKLYSQSQIMSLYAQPNPGREEVNISCQLNQPSQSSLRFFSTTGKLIYYEDFSLQKGFNALPTINTSSWSKGMYYYQLQTGETMQTGKWVKE